MRQPRRVVLLCLLAALGGASLASASGFGLFQHGGRAMGQAGAFTARASEPSALTYNPAAITKLSGLQAQAGLDFNNAKDEYDNGTGSFSARHIIQFPPAVYATWRPSRGPIALGIGVDSPFYYSLDWNARLFPGRFTQRRTELRVFEVHPVLAYDLGDGWSVGGGLRYAFGNLDQDDNGFYLLRTTEIPPSSAIVEVERNASADVDALAWDLAVHYAAPSWGWGAVYRSPERLKGDGDVKYRPRDVPQRPGVDAALASTFRTGEAHQSFEIPREVRAGIWYAPYPELRVELDASFQSWSSLEATDITYVPNPLAPLVRTERTPRNWKDTTSLRLGIEGNITDRFLLFGGVASEPSPVPDETAEPGFPRGDAMVYAAGFSYEFPQISFDVGYSFHDHDDRRAIQPSQLAFGEVVNYGASDQVWGFAVRWRL